MISTVICNRLGQLTSWTVEHDRPAAAAMTEDLLPQKRHRLYDCLGQALVIRDPPEPSVRFAQSHQKLSSSLEWSSNRVSQYLSISWNNY